MVVLPILALVGYSGFLTATFGWRTLQAKRVTGESRWREPISRIDAIGETVCAAGCLLSLIAPALAMAGAVRPLRTYWPEALVGFAVTLGLGTTLAIWAQRHLAEEWRAGVEASDTLITTGPFARIRNPFHLGCFLASASVLAAVPSPVALVGLALHIAAAEIIVRGVEEPILAQAHGSAFSSYEQPLPSPPHDLANADDGSRHLRIGKSSSRCRGPKKGAAVSHVLARAGWRWTAMPMNPRGGAQSAEGSHGGFFEAGGTIWCAQCASRSHLSTSAPMCSSCARPGPAESTRAAVKNVRARW